MSREAARRTYNSARRTQQAARTRAEVLAAATELFERHGWRGTTIAAIAARAEVVIDTIYSGFGSKAGLLTAAKEAARDADEAGIPLLERPSFIELATRPPHERVPFLAAALAAANERTWKLDVVWRDAAAFEPAIREQVVVRELDRREHFRRALQLLLGADPTQYMVDAVWVVSGSELYAKLVDQAGLTPQQYSEWLSVTLSRLLGSPADATPAPNTAEPTPTRPKRDRSGAVRPDRRPVRTS